MSILNGPNGEFQLTPKPTERRGLGGVAEEAFAGTARSSCASSDVPVGHEPPAGMVESCRRRRALAQAVGGQDRTDKRGSPGSKSLVSGFLRPNTAPTSTKTDGRMPSSRTPRAERNFELGAGQIISPAAERVVGDRVAVGRPRRTSPVGIVTIGRALDARADAANVEAADLRLAEEEAVGQPDRIDARAAAVLEAVDVAALGRSEKMKPPQTFQYFAPLTRRAQIL